MSQSKMRSGQKVLLWLIGLAFLGYFAFFNAATSIHLTVPPIGGASSTSADTSSSGYVSIARADALVAGINPDHFVRQIQQESGFNPGAISSAGAIGIAQFMPDTASGMGVNPYDPVSSLKGAALLDASHIRAYGGDEAKGYAAYNAGAGAVNSAVARCGASWEQCIPTETQNYIHDILE